MQSAEFEAVVPLSCREAFNMAANLEGYKDFLPILDKVEVLEKSANTAKARFTFNLDDTLKALARQFSIAVEDQVSAISWKDGEEISAESIKGPMKAMTMRARLTPVDANRTKVNLDIAFESGKGWLIDKALMFGIKTKAASLIRNIDAELAEFLKNRKPGPA